MKFFSLPVFWISFILWLLEAHPIVVGVVAGIGLILLSTILEE